jgi:hypothetical protein
MRADKQDLFSTSVEQCDVATLHVNTWEHPLKVVTFCQEQNKQALTALAASFQLVSSLYFLKLY